MTRSLACAALVLLGGCQTTEPAAEIRPRESAREIARRIEAAHGLERWLSKQAVAMDISVSFGGNEVLSGAMVYDYHDNLVRIDTDAGPSLVFDGRAAWVTPASAAAPSARFHLLTWSYFLAAPFKLQDPGSHLVPAGMLRNGGRDHPAATLTFEAGTGDTPDDWYVVYMDPETDRLAGLAYIVTYGDKSREEAEAEPHFIRYEHYVPVDGVLLSGHWVFYLWSEQEGSFGEPISEVNVSNLRFVTPDPDTFARPQDAREDALPGRGG